MNPFIEELRGELDKGRRNRAVDLIYEVMDELGADGDFESIDWHVRAMLAETWPAYCYLSVLIGCKPWAGSLPVLGEVEQAVTERWPDRKLL